MICRCFGHSVDLGRFGIDPAALARSVGTTARLMVGQPDYDGYVTHLATSHPEQEPMTRAEFYREREAARFGNSRMRCC